MGSSQTFDMIRMALVTTIIDMALNSMFNAIERNLNVAFIGNHALKVGDYFDLIMIGGDDYREYYYGCQITTISGVFIYFSNQTTKTVKNGEYMGDEPCEAWTKARIEKNSLC